VSTERLFKETELAAKAIKRASIIVCKKFFVFMQPGFVITRTILLPEFFKSF
jgi:hypothetical protein